MYHKRKQPPRKVAEIAVFLTEGQLKKLKTSLTAQNIAFYIEPLREPPYLSIEEIKEECEEDLNCTHFIG